MSSPIHGARCVGRDGARVDIELVPTTACGAHFPFSRFFGLSLLYESATSPIRCDRGTPVWRSQDAPGGPIAGEVAFDELIELTDVETPDEMLIRPPTLEMRRAQRERKHSLVERFVAGVSYCEVRHWRPLICRARSGRYFEAADRAAAGLREAQEALQDAFDRAPADEDGCPLEGAGPSANLRIEATDFKWVSHLETGMSWDVYVFDNDAGLLV